MRVASYLAGTTILLIGVLAISGPLLIAEHLRDAGIAAPQTLPELQRKVRLGGWLVTACGLLIGVAPIFEKTITAAWRAFCGDRLPAAMLVGAVCVGSLLRVLEFAADRSLWSDTLDAAECLIHRRYLGFPEFLCTSEPGALVSPMPLGYYLVSDLIGWPFNYVDWSLKLFALGISLATLLMFVRLCREVLPKSIAFLPAIFLACSRTSIMYSAEFRPYANDVFFTVALIYLFLRWSRSPAERALYWQLLLIGAVSIWFSYAAVIMLLGLGSASLLVIWKPQSRQALRCFLWLALPWCASMGLLYVLSIRHQMRPEIVEYHRECFAALPFSVKSLLWYLKTFFLYFSYPAGFDKGFILPAAVFALGVFRLLRIQGREAAMYLLPFGMLWVLSLLRRYPIATGYYPGYARLVFFSVPIAYILVAHGVQWLCGRAGGYYTAVWVVIPLIALCTTELRFITGDQGVRPMVEYVQENCRTGDALVTLQSGDMAWWYYGRFAEREPSIPVVSLSWRDEQHSGVGEIVAANETLHNASRVWLLMHHTYLRSAHTRMLAHFGRFGRISYRREGEHGSFVYLFEK